MKKTNRDIALRGIGPKVFISYCFKDQFLAEGLAEFLKDNGFQVRMEDETSLVGKRLENELNRRIGDVECFIQMYTEASSNSHWVKKELEYAEEIKKQKFQSEGKFSYEGNELIIAPVVLHSDCASEIFSDLAFIDATRDGLSPTILQNIKKVCLQSVRLIEIDEDRPHQLRNHNILDFFESKNLKKRVIFDSSGYWLRIIDNLIKFAENAHTDERQAKQFIIQEVEHRTDIKWMLEIIDVSVEALLLCVNMQASKGFITPDEFLMVLSLFYKIPFFMHFFEILTMARSASIITLKQAVADEVDELHEFGNMMLQDTQDKAMAWAFRQVFDETELQSYSPSKRPLVKTRMVLSPLKKMLVKSTYPCYIHFPKLVLPYLMGTEVLPNPKVKEWAWTLFGLPQAAAYGIEIGAPYEREDRNVMYSAVNRGVGWFLNHYDDISPVNQ